MGLAGVCQVCENARAEHACRLCGGHVCDTHWSDAIGACSACARGVDGDTDEKGRDP